MAADVVLAKTAQRWPVLRVYRWQPYAISVGYNQRPEEIDLAKCQKDGIEVVKRPTGGRAIFHAHELTYCVVIPKQSPLFANNSIELYNKISLALVSGLRQIGLPVDLQSRIHSDPAFANYNHKFACFATSAKYEIQWQAQKLVGSAQRRFDSAVLQHGSILLGNDHLKIFEYLSSNNNGEALKHREQLRKKTVCIETILKQKVRYESLVPKLRWGFEKYFCVNLVEKPLNSDEQKQIELMKSNFIDFRRKP